MLILIIILNFIAEKMTISTPKLIFKRRDAILKKQPDEVLRIEDINHVIVFDSADSLGMINPYLRIVEKNPQIH